MTPSLKSLRYTTAIAVSLVALSTANQAQAQCVPVLTGGMDTIDCTGTSNPGSPLNLTAGDVLNNSAGTLTSGGDTIRGGGADNTVNNTATGTISGNIALNITGSGSTTVNNSGIITGSSSGILTGGADIINNQVSATISSTSTSSFNGGVSFGRGAATINNLGDILNENGGNAISFSQTGNGSSGPINNFAGGVIRGDRHGIAFDTDSSGASGHSGIITNDGVIEGTTGVGIISRAIGVTTTAVDTSFSGAVVNTGTITGNTGILAEADTSGGLAEAFISSIDNNGGTIEGTGGTAIQFTNITGVSALNISGGQIIGDVVDNNVANDFSPVIIMGSGFDTEGDFTVSSLAVNGGQEFRISTGDTFNTRSVSTAGTINFEVDAAGDVGLLNVTAGAIDLTGGAVGAEVDAGAALVDGQEILIGTGTADVIGTTGATGQALLAAANDSLLFDFSIADGGQADITGSSDASELFFLVSQAASAGGSAITNNANGAGATVNTLLGSVDPGLSAVLANVSAASTSEELEAVLQAVLPQVDGASLSAAQNVTNNTIRLVSDRLTSIRGGGGGSGVSSGDLAENLQVWAQVFGQIANQGERKGIAGFDADTYGTTFGVDTEGLYDGATIGVALSYANTDVDSDNATNTQSDINSYNVTLYGDYDLSNDSFIVGDIGYTYGDNETTRSNIGGVAGLNADSDYDSHQIQARVIVGRDYHPAAYEGLHITPKAQARYTHFRTEDIEETGAGGANLNVDSDSLNIFEVGVGVDVRKDYVQDNGGILSPEISVGYRYDLVGDAVETTSTFAAGGPSFRTEGADPDQDTLNLGFGVGYTTPNNMEFTASYDYEHKDEFNSSSAFIRVAAPF